MKEWLIKYKNDIFVGIIVFFLTSFFKISYDFLGDYVPSAGKSVFIILRDMIYYKSGQMSLYVFIASQLSFLYGYFCGFTFSFITTLAIIIIKKNSKDNMLTKSKSYFSNKKIIIELFIFIITIILSFTILFTFCYIPAEKWNSFERSITKITPYVEDSDIKILRSKWVSMNSKEYYLEIKNYIEEIRKKNNLK